jgi:hypothetical protein
MHQAAVLARLEPALLAELVNRVLEKIGNDLQALLVARAQQMRTR